MFVGLFISILSFYILMLSIYLLVQKNTNKLENLLLIGYSPMNVALPYQMLTILMNVIVLVLAIIFLIFIREYYMHMIQRVFPQMEINSIMPASLTGICLFILVSIFNIVAIRRKVMSIWKNRK